MREEKRLLGTPSPWYLPRRDFPSLALFALVQSLRLTICAACAIRSCLGTCLATNREEQVVRLDLRLGILTCWLTPTSEIAAVGCPGEFWYATFTRSAAMLGVPVDPAAVARRYLRPSAYSAAGTCWVGFGAVSLDARESIGIRFFLFFSKKRSLRPGSWLDGMRVGASGKVD